MSLGQDTSSTVVLDVGSNCTKAGFAGEDYPGYVFNSAVGKWNDACTGSYAVNRHEVWSSRYREHKPIGIQYPVVQGSVADWDCLEKVWDHIFRNELKITPCNCTLLIVEQSTSPQGQRERMVELLFEGYAPSGVFLGRSGMLSCVAAGKTTGLVVESGGGISTVVPVQDGQVLSSAFQKSALAGDLLTDELARRLSTTHDGGWPALCKCDDDYTAFKQRQHVQGIKETLCQLPEWTLPSVAQVPGLTARMPDGSEVKLHRDRFDVPEMLIEGVLNADVRNQILPRCTFCDELTTIPELLNKAVDLLEPDQAHKFYENTVICGGNSLFPRLADRLRLHIERTYGLQPGKRIIFSPSGPMDGPYRQRFSAWVGGSIVASFTGFKQMWMAKAEFDEHGVELLSRRNP